MTGYKTWTGILIAILGALGVSSVVGEDNLTGIIDALLQVIGFALAMWGNYKAHKTIAELE
jgi:hypothetical protein